MKAWFEDPKHLIERRAINQFWPNKNQTPEQRINAASRFIIYTTCAIYLIRRDPRIFILGGTVLGILYLMYRMNMVKETYVVSTNAGGCHPPSIDNPMGNVLITDYTDAPNRLSACYYPTVKPYVRRYLDDRIPYDGGRSRTSMPEYQRNAYARQFVTTPVSSIPGDQTAFAEWLYGSKNGSICKTNPRLCDPNARGVQLEAFGGIGSDSDKRSGMFGGGNGPA